MKKKLLKLLISFFVIILTILFFLPVYIYVYVRPSIYTDLDTVEKRKVGIVFGASVRPDKTPSDMLRDRLDTAYELFSEGKIEYILVSGDNSTKKYNEPSVMYNYLIEKGVPSEVLFKDYAGLRTYDSCKRANTLWKVNSATLITQEYHLYRAIYTCSNLGIDSLGFSASKHEYVEEGYYRFREYLATIKSFIDLYIYNPIYIGGNIEGDLSE